MSPASISTRSWTSNIATTRPVSIGASLCGASTSAMSARCQECSAVFSRRSPPRMELRRSTDFERVDLQHEREPIVELAHPSSTSHSNGVPSSACCISEVTRLSWSNIRITPKTMSTTAAVPTSSGK